MIAMQIAKLFFVSSCSVAILILAWSSKRLSDKAIKDFGDAVFRIGYEAGKKDRP